MGQGKPLNPCPPGSQACLPYLISVKDQRRWKEQSIQLVLKEFMKVSGTGDVWLSTGVLALDVTSEGRVGPATQLCCSASLSVKWTSQIYQPARGVLSTEGKKPFRDSTSEQTPGSVSRAFSCVCQVSCSLNEPCSLLPRGHCE